MMQATSSRMAWASAAVLCAVLVGGGCSGGETTGSAVTGVALSSAPIQGTVSLNDSSPETKQRTVATRADRDVLVRRRGAHASLPAQGRVAGWRRAGEALRGLRGEPVARREPAHRRRVRRGRGDA